MRRICSRFWQASAVIVWSCSTLAQQPPAVDVDKVVKTVSSRAATGQYSMEGALVLEGRQGANPARLLSKARFKRAAAPGGKSFLQLTPEGKDEYLLVSNGEKSWAFVPKLKKYTEEEASPVSAAAGSEGAREAGSTDERDMAEVFSAVIIESLADLFKTAQAADVHGTAQVKFEGRKATWPVVRVMSKEDPRNGRNLVELTIDPATLAIGRLVWANITNKGGEQTVLRMTVEYSRFRLGEPVDEATFRFSPPKNAKRVDAVPIPGQTGSFLLNQAAPDFELKTLEGERVRLSELRGKPVVLNFWASWCGPCRKELPELADLYDSLKDKGLLLYGVNDEGKGVARAFARKAGLSFPTLDDYSLKAHRLYRVTAVPTMFIIDREGRIVRFLRGSQDKAKLAAALKSVGF